MTAINNKTKSGELLSRRETSTTPGRTETKGSIPHPILKIKIKTEAAKYKEKNRVEQVPSVSEATISEANAFFDSTGANPVIEVQ